MAEGTVKWFNDKKGWDFIWQDRGPKIAQYYQYT